VPRPGADVCLGRAASANARKREAVRPKPVPHRPGPSTQGSSESRDRARDKKVVVTGGAVSSAPPSAAWLANVVSGASSPRAVGLRPHDPRRCFADVRHVRATCDSRRRRRRRHRSPSAHPGLHFTANTLMAVHVIDEGRRAASRRSSSSEAPIRIRRRHIAYAGIGLWSGPFGSDFRGPMVLLRSFDRDVAGISGRIRASLCRRHSHQCVRPACELRSESSHVVPALIRGSKRPAARAPEVVCWGTGKRHVIFCTWTMPRGIVRPPNGSTDPSPSTSRAAWKYRCRARRRPRDAMADFKVECLGMRSKPTGHPRRALDISCARTLSELRPTGTLQEVSVVRRMVACPSGACMASSSRGC